MILTTQDSFSEYEIINTLGVVKGSTVRARHLGKDIFAAIRNIVGGEIPEYTKMLAESREQAYDRMIDEAKQLSADGIVCLRFASSSLMQGAAEILVYGTAVKLKKKTQ
ncbi:MAG: YbjQ family protein [Candidatus Marinimicrobia bacterium]|nr:YbjQ family protein [Candidatus Neomarinimicrobiota bacterium]